MNKPFKTLFQTVHLDKFLLIALGLLIAFGLFILFSASEHDIEAVFQQLIRFGIGFAVLILAAQIPPEKYRLWVPWVYGVGVLLLILVLIIGHTGKGAQRWLDLGFVKFQPSEVLKIATPAMVAWYLGIKELPPRFSVLMMCFLITGAPALLILKQPDLGTAIMIGISGGSVILLSGISWRWLSLLFLSLLAMCPVLWFFMHDYQKQRVLTFLNPNRDPLGAGYHIIQSKIAIGSGGVFGKGFFQGTQSHLNFLPEHSTDFIFSVLGEELGLFGALILLGLYCVIFFRCLYIASEAGNTFSRLLTGSLALTFFIAMFINIGMVTGILPVVGIPLPLVSYGGTSIVTLMAGFGIIMAVHTHKSLVR
jgi:rod shape determining protein RodA